MRVLGIDPGLRTTGFGVIDYTQQRLKYVASGTISTDSSTQSTPERLGPKSTLLLGQARGASISAIVCQNIEVVEFSALEVKKNVVGHGRAAKSQVQEMVKRLLSLKVAPGTDASDALAVAICGAHEFSMKHQLQAAHLKAKS